MNNRWHMNRIGFVNFWLYDEQIFMFKGGKMLLRGQNASGKSITTQSIIPFILDGDRAPSRLDPFGSSDRRMEYYFLGEGDLDDVTGYLFLEFKKENTEQYRTIGIGQRAQKGKPMGFWGFVILDGRRIGYDINLYKNVGSKKIPFLKQELKKYLGEDTPFTDAQKEYMSMVNKYIFGFPRIEQYEQFVKLLIKVRAPKLSKEFKPTKVYEILNDSLQTLSDEDLRAMVDAMEKMDDIQNKLDNLKLAFKDLQSIRSEYIRYNQYMLANKAQAYIDAKNKAESELAKLDLNQTELKSKQEEVSTLSKQKRIMKDEIDLLEKEKEALDVKDMEISIDKLDSYKKDKITAETERDRLIKIIEKRREKINYYDSDKRQYKNEIEEYDIKINKNIQDLEYNNEIIEFSKNTVVKSLVHAINLEKAYDDVIKTLKGLESSVDEGIKIIKKLDEITEKWNLAEEELSNLRANKKQSEEQLASAESMEDDCRDYIVEQFYIAAEKYEELVIEKIKLAEIISMINKYSGARDLGDIKNCTLNVFENKRSQLLEEQLKKENEQHSLYADKVEAETELESLIKMKEPVPMRKEKVNKAREILHSKNIKCIPFYEAVEFSDNISQPEQDLLESQLTDAGLLDALIVSADDYSKALNELSSLSDVIISAADMGKSTFNKLVISEIETELKEAVKIVLSNMYETKEEEALFILSSNGYFKNGILEGYSYSDEQASYIGAAARKKKKERLIADKQAEIAVINEKLNALDNNLKAIGKRILVLEEEYKGLPKFDDLDQAIDMVRSAAKDVDEISNKCKAKEKEAAGLADKKKSCAQKMIETCKLLPYVRTVESYEEVMENIKEYFDHLTDLERNITHRESGKSKYEHVFELIDIELAGIDEDDLRMKREIKSVKKLEIEIRNVEEFLNNPENKGKAEKFQNVKKLLNEKDKMVNESEIRLCILSSDIEKLVKEIQQLKENTSNIIECETKLRKYFEEELSLGLVVKQESRLIYDVALEASNLLKENDKNKSVAAVVTSLCKSYQMHSSNLTSYGTCLEDCFDDDINDTGILRKRQRIASTWQGKKLYLEEFYGIIKDSIETTELLIQQKDRELFENIMADTLSRKLNNRIAESRKWIKDMSNLMKDMDTSMALTFSLDWKPKTAESDKELDTMELEKLLSRDRELLTTEDIERVSAHFRTKIRIAKQVAEENGEIINYADLVRDALDYRKWFEFKMNFYKNNDGRKELTNSAFNKFSGGEKAMAMYVPLFAAVNAQYKKSENPDHPRIIALDEAFAGVDDKNISSMFKLVQQLDYDYIMNSQALWGCYETVKSLRIKELYRPANSSVISVINYFWNGHERILDEQ